MKGTCRERDPEISSGLSTRAAIHWIYGRRNSERAFWCIIRRDAQFASTHSGLRKRLSLGFQKLERQRAEHHG